MDEQLTYEAAFDELQRLTREIESEEVPVDELAARVARANELIAFCKSKLRAAEEEVAAVVKRIAD